MGPVRRVLVSSPRDTWLDRRRRDLKRGIVTQIGKAGYRPQFFDVPGGGDLVKGRTWNVIHIDAVVRRCVGVVVLGLARWEFVSKGRPVLLPSEYCHYEGSLAYTYNLPILALAEAGIEQRGIFIPYGLPVVTIPPRAGAAWLRTPLFRNAFLNWESALDARQDVFLGYSSKARKPATKVKRYLQRALGVRVLDWNEDFAPAGSILERIKDAAARCSAGIFLFMRDDRIESKAAEAAPRDNVVFEAGFFAHAKGKERVLIIRERGSKMPADLGGDIYASLTDRADIKPITGVLTKFVRHL